MAPLPRVYNTIYSKRIDDNSYLALKLYPEKGHLILWEEFELTMGLVRDIIC